jgi:voltage-gated sodium channel type II alpha
MKNKLAETARLVIRTRQLMTNLQQLKSTASTLKDVDKLKMEKENEFEEANKEQETLSLKSYGSHTYFPIEGKGKKKEQVVTINPDMSEEGHSESEDEDDDDTDDDDEEWGDEDGIEEVDENVDEKPRRSIHSSNKQEEEQDTPIDCFPPDFYQRLFIFIHRFPILKLEGTKYGHVWSKIRLKTFRLIENKYFETAVITMILLSSLALALEDVHLPQNPILTDILFYMDRIFTVIFFIEMIIKWLAMGFVAYFTNAWCWLDFVCSKYF